MTTSPSGLLARLRDRFFGVRRTGARQPARNSPRPAPAELPGAREGPPAALTPAVLEVLEDPVLVADGRLRLHWCNAAARRLFPLAEPGRDVRVFLRASAMAEALSEIAAGAARSGPITLRHGERGFAAYARRVAVDGRQDAGGRILIVLKDVTAEERAARMRADFVANVSHELKTPLAALLGFIETLSGPARDDPAARARFLALMEAEARRMNRLVDDLLSLSRLEAEPPLAADARADLVAVVRRVVAVMGGLAEDSGVTLAAQIALDAAPVAGEEDRLVQMLTNLVDNAIKYGRPGPVTISLAAENGAWLLTVADRGPGIPPEHLPRLTERFYRVDAARSRSLGGTGLGLALVKHIVRRHGGRLEIASRPGAGTTVSVRLPAAGADGADGGQPKRPVM